MRRLLLLLGMLLPLVAHATTVEVTPNLYLWPTVEGFSFSNECLDGDGYAASPWVPYAGDNGGTVLTYFCAHDDPRGGIWITRDYGQPFTLLSFRTNNDVRVFSNKGGSDLSYTQYPGEDDPLAYLHPLPHTYTGDQWSNITSLYISPCFFYLETECHSQAYLGDFHFTVQVPEPAPWTLMLPAVGLLALRRSRRGPVDRMFTLQGEEDGCA